MKKLPVLFIFLFSSILVSSVAHADRMGKLLFIPTVPGKGADLDRIEQIDSELAASLQTFKPFTVEKIDDFRSAYGDKRAERLELCAFDKDCILKLMRGTDYDLVLIGNAVYKNDDSRYSFDYVVVNVRDGEVKRQKKIGLASKDPFRASGEGKKWVKALLVPPEPLLKESDFFEGDEELVAEGRQEKEIEEVSAAAIALAPARSRTPLKKMPSEQDVQAGLKQAYTIFVGGELERARQLVRKVVSNRCACDADSQALAMKGLMDAFASSKGKVDRALASKNSKDAVIEIEEMGALEAQLAAEGQKLGVQKESAFRAGMGAKFAEAYTIEADAFKRASKFVDARESYKKVLEYDPKNTKAAEEIKNMPRQAQALFMQGSYMADFDPNGAIAKLKQVMALVEASDPLYSKAEKKIKEIESRE